MDLLNKDFYKFTRDLQSNAVPTFRQDPKLVEAIDKLFYSNHLRLSDARENGQIVLPERKLQFHEVQDLLKLSLNGSNRLYSSMFCYYLPNNTEIVNDYKILQRQINQLKHCKKIIIKG